MALAHQHPRSTIPVGSPGGVDALHELAAALADVQDHLGREVLAAVVERLESLADVPLGAVGTDPIVVLQRRAARALRLLTRSGAAVDAALLPDAAADLRDPCAALLRTSTPPVPTLAPAATSGPAPAPGRATTHEE